ncbi:MAG: hypothetical protein R2688_10900 [Fimbriimonadaceae bacterium]
MRNHFVLHGYRSHKSSSDGTLENRATGQGEYYKVGAKFRNVTIGKITPTTVDISGEGLSKHSSCLISIHSLTMARSGNEPFNPMVGSLPAPERRFQIQIVVDAGSPYLIQTPFL